MRKIIFFLAAGCFLHIYSHAQTNTFPSTGSVGVGTTVPKASAILDVQSSSQGVLIPRMTQAQRDAIANPANGLLIFQTNNARGFYFFNGTAWVSISTGSAKNNLSNLLANTAVNVPLLPGADDSISLGSNTFRWRKGFFSDTVNIGSGAPTSRLNIAGTIKIMDGTQGMGKVLTSNANGLASWTTPAAMPKGHNNQTMRFNGTNIQASSALINTGTAIGIGELNPQGVLHVSEPFNFSGIVYSSSNGNGLNDLSVDNSGFSGSSPTTYVIRIQNAGPNPNIIEVSNDSGATFGAPVAITNPINLANGVTATFASPTGHTFGDSWTWTVGPSFKDLLVVKGGKVGIGTANPDFHLDVNGSTRSVSVVTGSLKVSGSSPGVGKVLTSDSEGNATWSSAPGPVLFSSPWMISPYNSRDTVIDGTCMRLRHLDAPEITPTILNSKHITVYFRVGSIGPYQLPYISDAGGATNQINCIFNTGKIFVYRHTYNTCRFNSSIAESYPGQPVLVNLPQSLEYRYVITQ